MFKFIHSSLLFIWFSICVVSLTILCFTCKPHCLFIILLHLINWSGCHWWDSCRGEISVVFCLYTWL